MGSFTAATLDFKEPTVPTRTYLIASSFRSGSNYLCLSLWETGVLGAPWEYFNIDTEQRFMYSRLGAQSPGDYLRKLTARRTSPNGVFGVKAHFRHFEHVLREYPPLLQVLRDVKFVYMNRRDKVAQAVSMARAYQTGTWFAFTSERFPVFYSAEFIDQCMEELNKQALAWVTWFRESGLTPLTIHYESLVADPDATVAAVADYLGVDLDPTARIEIPKIVKQADEINLDWCGRYRQDRNLPPTSKHDLVEEPIPS